jgi:S-adenosylmethionine:tRNA ribosyltransferase-isomerase
MARVACAWFLVVALCHRRAKGEAAPTRPDRVSALKLLLAKVEALLVAALQQAVPRPTRVLSQIASAGSDRAPQPPRVRRAAWCELIDRTPVFTADRARFSVGTREYYPFLSLRRTALDAWSAGSSIASREAWVGAALDRGTPDAHPLGVRFADFDYHLPEEQIARQPVEPRDSARLCVLDRSASTLVHASVRDLPRFLVAGDLLVANDTRVRPARLVGQRASGGKVELLLVDKGPTPAAWRALAKPAAKLHQGEVLELEGGALRAKVLGRLGRETLVELACDGDLEQSLERHGRMPLPPYILKSRGAERDPAADRASYQTIFAKERGAIAAPTAGLHFTPRLLEELSAAGVERASLTLHVGIGTFAPVECERLDDHRMHAEDYVLGEDCVAAMGRAKSRGGRVVALGTTSARVLESCARPDGTLAAGAGATSIFLRPGSRFAACDALFTNFHLPRSTLLVLVAAFAGRERVLAAYEECARAGYRFYSYGDAMLIL